jgi:hypothetical protein
MMHDESENRPATACGSVSYDPETDAKPTSAQYEAFQAAFDHFNRELFDGELPTVMLTFSRKSRAKGFFAPDRWEDAEVGSKVSEIALNPDLFNSRTARDTASTVVHEMVHLWQEVFGKPSRRGYHNKEWADRMEELGLMPSTTGEPGGKRVGQSVTHYVVDSGRFVRAFSKLAEGSLLPFTSGDGRGLGQPGLPGQKNRNKIAYACPSCSDKVWGRPGLRIVCGVCEVEFEGGAS